MGPRGWGEPKPLTFDAKGLVPEVKIIDMIKEVFRVTTAKNKHVVIDIAVVKLTESSYIALATLGGITVRSSDRAKDEAEAVTNLLRALAVGTGDAGIALDLAIAGATMADFQQTQQIEP